MKKSKTMDLKTKLTLYSLFTSTVIVLLTSASYIVAEVYRVRQGTADHLAGVADIVIKNVLPAIRFDDRPAMLDTLSSLRADKNIRHASVYDKNGKRLASFPVERQPQLPSFLADSGTGMEKIYYKQDEVHIFRAIMDESKVAGYLWIAYGLSELYGYIRKIILITFIIMFFAIGGAYVISKKLAGVIAEPLLYLTKLSQAISKDKDYSRRAQKKGNDEVGLLTDAFNDMLMQIQKRDTRLKDYSGHLETQVALRTSELTRLVDELRMAKTEAERANQTKSEFLSKMSHELRTPLNAIIGFGQLLQMGALEREQSDYVVEMLYAGRHLLDLINEVLDLAKIEAGRVDVNLTTVNLPMLVRDCFSLMRPIAAEHEVKLVNTIDQSEAIYVQADPTHLKQVLINLLSNGVKYNKKYGSVTVKAYSSAGSVHLGVIDTGKGLSEDQVQRLFTPFERFGAENTPVEGTGIGLVICHRLVEMMQGGIEVQSKPGEGSRMWLTLPEADEEPLQDLVEQVKKLPASAQNIGENFSVLYIEDNPVNRKLMAKIFETQQNTEFRSARDATVGIDMARQLCPHIILLDLNLPDRDGFEVLKELRGLPETRDIPVIAVSARAMPEDVELALKRGFNSYLTKPINVNTALEEVYAFASHKRSSLSS